MAKVLLINPSKWGRGITPIWIASHAAVLKSKNNHVELFDSTFYENWSVNEIEYNTSNNQYLPSDYFKYIKYNSKNIFEALQEKVFQYEPDVIFWSAFSSHIHGEGEYVNIQYGYELIKDIETTAILVTGGLQPTADPKRMLHNFPKVDYFLRGETEFTLAELVEKSHNHEIIKSDVKGLAYKCNGTVYMNHSQDIIADMDSIPFYDYSLFEDQIFYRPYNGNVVKAVDYELSRGCPYTCTYCVETVIQKYYGFNKIIGNGVLRNAKKYLRNKSAKRIFEEMKFLYNNFGIEYFRCQDTNFLTINLNTLKSLSRLMESNNLPTKLYIETRPETVRQSVIQMMKSLNIDGVGMGIELASEDFRKSSLNRYPSQSKIINAFKLLKEEGIKRTAYNIIGLPNETEEMILETIKFNQILNPDNITVAFYSPYIGTKEQDKSTKIEYFENYEYDVDGQIRSLSHSKLVNNKTLNFYKNHFNDLVRNGLTNLDSLKRNAGIR